MASSSSDDKDRITDETHKKQRVKARWALLFKALNGSASTDDGDNNGGDSYSMNSFPGFGVLQRTVVNDNDEECNRYQSYAIADEIGEWNIISNSYTTVDGSTIQFYTREVKKQSHQMKKEALFSHRKYGVDNTGNVRVWDAESTLAGFLFFFFCSLCFCGCLALLATELWGWRDGWLCRLLGRRFNL